MNQWVIMIGLLSFGSFKFNSSTNYLWVLKETIPHRWCSFQWWLNLSLLTPAQDQSLFVFRKGANFLVFFDDGFATSPPALDEAQESEFLSRGWEYKTLWVKQFESGSFIGILLFCWFFTYFWTCPYWTKFKSGSSEFVTPWTCPPRLRRIEVAVAWGLLAVSSWLSL